MKANLILKCARCGAMDIREWEFVYFSTAIPEVGQFDRYAGTGIRIDSVHRCSATRVGVMVLQGFDILDDNNSGMEPELGSKYKDGGS